jgi:hypothetical protein
MADTTRIEGLVPVESLEALEAAGPVDVLVGVPALNQARSITQVVTGLAEGLKVHFPGRKAALLVVDVGSQDGTFEALRAWRETAPAWAAIHDVRLPGPPQRGRAILTILAAAQRLKARGCGLVDADQTSIAPVWVDLLLRPVIREEADFVSPTYTRPVSEGTLTTNLLAPLTRALYGTPLQQPMGGCVGLSGDLVGRFLQADVWTGDLMGHGLDLWLTTEALASGARLVEAHFGRKTVEPPSGQPDLATTVVRVVGPLFRLMERYHAVWDEVRGSTPLPLAGRPAAILPEPGEIPVDRMVRGFRLGLKDLLPLWEQVMPEETLTRLYPLALLAADEYRFPPPMWARVVSDFALAYHERRLPRDHLLRSLTPLYLGRVAAFLREARAAAPSRLSETLEAIGRAFEAEKEYLRARWR